ncbi:peptidase S28 [Lentinula raphanica]|nr:peptidase S28 [Lentinula raphanica]
MELYFLPFLLAFLLLRNAASAIASRQSSSWNRPRTRIFDRFDFELDLNALPDSSETLFIDMPLDHFANSTVDGVATFKNRYWINATYYETGGPVFIFDSGEQDAAPLGPYYLQEYHGLSATMRLAKRYGGLAILWEHRYYGDSLPFPINRNTTAEQWQFLTTEQALQDVVFFADSFSKNTSSLTDLTTNRTFDPQSLPVHPSVTPWVWLGGSYPGVRGALLRQRNPETIFAAWASSAPVHAQVDMWAYYEAAQRSLTVNCSADWVAVTSYVDNVLQGSNATLIEDVKFDLLKARLSGPGGNTTGADGLTKEQANKTSDVDAASILMDPLDFYQYYGFAASLLPFCNLLETKNFTSDPVENGIVSVTGVEDTFQAFLVALAELDYDSIPGSPDDPVADMSWMRQYCSEYGFYQRGNSNNPLSIETSFLSLELFQQQCNDTFSDHLPSWPQVENINKYGGWDMQPSNIMFANGEFDPWRTMGLASIETNAPQRKPSVIVPQCNVPSNATTFFGITYDNMVHVSDMRVLLVPDSNHSDFRTIGFYSPISQEPFYTGLGLFQLALDEWLPCFATRSK